MPNPGRRWQKLEKQPYWKELPRGLWLYFNKLPKGFSDKAFQDFLAEAGIIIPLERISVQWYSDGAAAKVSVSNVQLTELVNWLLDGKILGGHVMLAASVTDDRLGDQALANMDAMF